MRECSAPKRSAAATEGPSTSGRFHPVNRHYFKMEPELMRELVLGCNPGITHHLHDGEQVSRRLAALRDVRRAGVPEVGCARRIPTTGNGAAGSPSLPGANFLIHSREMTVGGSAKKKEYNTSKSRIDNIEALIVPRSRRAGGGHRRLGAKGEEHARCANECISRDVPAALLTEDGTLYLLLNERPARSRRRSRARPGRKVTARGKLVERGGIKALQVATIE